MSTAARPPSKPEPGLAPGAEPVELVADRPRSATGPTPLGWLPVPAEGHGPDELLAAFLVVLYKYTGQHELLLDVELAGWSGALAVTVDPDATGPRLLATAAHGPARHTPVRFTGASGIALSDNGEPAADLVLSAGPEPRIGYRTGLFSAATATGLAEHLRRALRQSHLPVRTVRLADEADRALVLGRFNDTTRPYPAESLVHRLFSEQVRRAPGALAVSWRDERLTYRQLDERAERLAGALRAAGVRPGDLVALRVGRTPDLPAGVLAILKAGAGYLPIDPDYPPGRVEFLLTDSRARVLVTDSALPAAFDGTVLDPAGRTAEPIAPDLVAPDLPADRAVAFLCYTSGTTGRPKGVRVTHRNIVRLVRGVEYSDLGPHTRILLTGSISFDASTFELWATLLNGGSLHLVGTDVLFSARALKAELAAERITTLWLTAPLFNQIVEQDPATFGTLRELYTGGDVLSPSHVAKVLAACPDLILINAYGPTENGTYSLTHRIERSGFDVRASVPIGRPIANSTAYLLDPDGNLCPVGVPGELCFGGDGVAAGYLDRPELTAEKFVADPFRDGVMYRSGDLGRFRPDGEIEFLGRRDEQVKVRGFRIELGEVEHALLGHPDVAEAAVTARPRPGGADKYLCGYYVPRRSVTGLRTYLERLLPAHAVPAYLVELAELPLHASGKLDRTRLPEPDAAHLVTGTEYVAPRDDFERALVELAENALGMAGIGLQHDLRELGADSLTATLLAAGLGERLGRQLPVSVLLHAGTLAQLAELVRHADAAAATGIAVVGEAESYPVTPQQRQLYLEQVKDPEAVHYNVPVSLRLPPGTDPDRLAAALHRLAERHEALRTCFVLAGAQVRQRIEPEIRLPLRVVDQPAAARPFALDRAPLWRAELHRPDNRLRLEFHHLVVDGFSLRILLDDLAALYAGQPVADAGVRYRDYATWLAGPAGVAVREHQRSYWQQVFAVPPERADLPLSVPRPPLRPLAGGVLDFDLGPGRTGALKALARSLGVPLFAVLAAGYGIVLARLTGSSDVLLGTPVSGRTAPGLHRTVGMLANTVCLRVTAAPGAAFADYLREVANTAEDAFAHADFPFADVVEIAAPHRDYRRAPLFDALIALHSNRYLHLDFAGHGVDLTVEPAGQTPFDLNLQVFDTGDTLRAAWHYASALVHRADIEQWRQDFLRVLDTVLADPGTPVGAFTAPATVTAPAAFDFDL